MPALPSFNCKLLTGLLYAATAVGVLKISAKIYGFLSLIVNLFLLPPVDYSKFGAKKGAWAVITGASEGIGQEFAKQLASRGLNVVLVSRTQAKLEEIATEIESKYKVQTRVVAADCSKNTPELYASLYKAIEELPVSVLINNVGRSHAGPVLLEETPDDELENILTINNAFLVKMTKLTIPLIDRTVKSKQAAKGLIVNVGSFAGLFPTPYLAVYSGSKAFLQNFSQALSIELKEKNIEVELILAYFVTTALSAIRRSSFFIPTPKKFVAATLRNMGRRGGAQDRFATSSPYPSHALINYVANNTLGVFSEWIAQSTYNNMKITKAKRLRKLQKQKAAKAE
ncbi:hypothetical protein OGAPHI_002480 [Ogataea philodendri]|uniref:Very-long-chain 3-oxoacyl-CoA reductase n=1 Tax=Ogataea philodendri TaxID=1378263 RepID=A0A9P8PBI5_9ASCO|nr:uncharacterized protein OGAPHI_002480 [Ogataea philodendri]KAH3668726.1 hypothetical protein OGAPHI_002480 [Ogataea philodendri]